MSSSSSNSVPPLLITEALGFSPQLLLDDIINIANAAVTDGVNGLEGFLENWAEQRPDKQDNNRHQEIESGLVAFQTLLEHHTDLAFDFFEAWCLRNIFAIPPDLPIVLPHQENLDLTAKPEKEEELIEEVARLRAEIDSQRRLHLLLTRALRTAKRKRLESERRLERISSLDPHRLDILAKLPAQLLTMHDAVSNLPPMDAATIAAMTQITLSEPGKRQWETSKTGYLELGCINVAGTSKGGRECEGSATIDGITRNVEEIGKADQLRQAFEITESIAAGLRDVDRGLDSSQMEE